MGSAWGAQMPRKGSGGGRSNQSSVHTVRLSVTASALMVACLLAAGPNATPAAASRTAQADDTWAGRIERHGSHHDYVGRACPEGAEVCVEILARYRIMPTSPSAARAVRRLAGGEARLTGRLVPAQDEAHGGRLLVRRAERRTAAAPPRTVRLDDTSDGSTVHLAPGDRVRVVLHSTYWTFRPPSDRAVVAGDGPGAYASGPNCPTYPGSGCGTVTVRYSARHAGAAVIAADRTSCGEAIRCTPAALHWSVNVAVSGSAPGPRPG